MSIKPVVDGLESEYSGRIMIYRVDIDTPAGQYLFQTYNLQVTPSFLFFDAAGRQADLLGSGSASDPNTLKQKLNGLLKGQS